MIGGPLSKVRVVIIPDLPATVLNLIPCLQLGKEKSRKNVGGQVTRAQIHPGIFINLTAEEATAIGSFLANDLCTLYMLRIVNKQRPTFATTEVLGFMKTL